MHKPKTRSVFLPARLPLLKTCMMEVTAFITLFFWNVSTLNNSLKIFTHNFKNSHSTVETSHFWVLINLHTPTAHIGWSKNRLHIYLLHSGEMTCQIQPWIDFRQISSKASSVPCRRSCCVAIRHTPPASWEKNPRLDSKEGSMLAEKGQWTRVVIEPGANQSSPVDTHFILKDNILGLLWLPWLPSLLENVAVHVT